MTSLKDLIREKRPKLGDSSITTYNSILKNLYKRVFPDDKEMDIKKFDETEKILSHLKSIPSSKRKTILSSLVVITNENKYRDLMLDDIKVYNKESSKQEKSETQKENWVDNNDIKTVWNKLKTNTDLLYKKKQLTSSDLQEIQAFIILSCLGGIFIIPRRNRDYCDFKIKDIDKKKDNYLDKNEIVFNSYKTKKFYGEQRIEIPHALKSILKKWIKVNPTNCLLFDIKNKPLSSVQLNQRMNKIFGGKKVGVNIIRHSYLTDKYAETIKTNQALAQDMENMGSSTAQSQIYIKKE